MNQLNNLLRGQGLGSSVGSSGGVRESSFQARQAALVHIYAFLCDRGIYSSSFAYSVALNYRIRT